MVGLVVLIDGFLWFVSVFGLNFGCGFCLCVLGGCIGYR